MATEGSARRAPLYFQEGTVIKILFYDFEVFKEDWLVVALDMVVREEHVIANDRDRLQALYDAHKSDVWAGYNSRGYDQYVLKAILLGFDPKELSDFIIRDGRRGWEFSRLFNRIPLNNYDVMQNIDRGLKVFEGFMGASIEESSVPFDIDRRLTTAELADTISYCRHDVEQTVEVFLRRKADFDAQMGLLRMFGLPLSKISKTKAQLAADILGASRRTYHDEFDIDFPDTMRIERHREVVDWYADPANRRYRVDPSDPKSAKTRLEVTVAGVPHTFGWGGVHGAIDGHIGRGYYINMDVASLYPSLMIRYGLLSRSCRPERFADIVARRLEYKREGNPLQKPLKIVINSTYGASKDPNNPLYDPRQANRVCVYGQLLILDLMERLEEVGALIIQSNTDGVLVKMPEPYDQYQDLRDGFFDIVDDVAHEWEGRTGLTLEFDEYEMVAQKDVNNYVMVTPDGKAKTKGAWTKALGDLDYDLAVVNRAVVASIVHGTPVEETVYGCDELRDFQQVRKIGAKYDYLWHGGAPLRERCVRVFADKRNGSGGLMMRHHAKSTLDRVAGTPERCAIVNGDITGAKCPEWLDKGWYADLARRRLAEFGVAR